MVSTSGSVFCLGTRSFKSVAQSRGTEWVEKNVMPLWAIVRGAG